MKTRFHRLRVAETRQETKAAISLYFEVPEALREIFRWRPGQHLTLRFHLGGEEVRRPYSISSSPFTGEPLRITVKRVPNGLVSNHINDSVSAGAEIEVTPPFGGFCLDPVANGYRTHYFFGAGSGITPLFSMLASVLHAEPYSSAYLIYGNTDVKNIIFKEPLAALSTSHPDRLAVVHTLSSPSLWSSFQAWSGRIDARIVGRFIEEYPPYAQDTQYHVCGPGDMNACVRGALMDLDVPQERIHLESYRAGDDDFGQEVESVDAVATVTLDDTTTTVEVPKGKTVLEALLDAGLRPPYSCQAGVCSACRARIVRGKVHMRSHMALEEGEVATGAFLTCQALPLTELLDVRYED